MKRALNVILLVCAINILGACNKFSNGDVIEKPRQLDESFQMIELNDDVNVTLKHCDAEHPAGYIMIKTGENLWDNISAEVEVDTFRLMVHGTTVNSPFNKLVIRNNNDLDFLRPYDYTLEMTIYYDSIISIIFNSNGVINSDTLRGYNYLTHFTQPTGQGTSIEFDSLAPNLHLDAEGGSGDLNVLTNCNHLTVFYSHGTSNIILRGKVECAEIYGDYDCHGIIDGKDMETTNYYGTFNGTNTIIAKAFDYLSATNNNIGRIYYAPYPKKTKAIIWGHYDEEQHWIENDTIDTVYYCPRRLLKLGDHIENIMPYPD